MNIKNISTFIFCISLFLPAFLVKAQKTQTPNIILIVADDLGYSDVEPYGGEIDTPVLQKLATEGLRLTNMHNAGMCVISRASMLTGKWWPRTGYGMENTETNLALELQKNGYRTGLVGKWHLDGEPNNKGFDYFFGFLNGYASYFDGNEHYRLNSEKFKDFGDNFYSTDEFTNKAIDFISQNEKNDEAPFFLYLSYQAPHNPLQNTKEDIMKYRGQYLEGWKAVRDNRIDNMIEMGIIDPETPLPDYPQNLPDWDSLTEAQKNLEDLRMAVYASMVESMDRGIGRIMEALKSQDKDKNTLILFLSDNGTDSFSVLDKVMLNKDLLPGDKGSNYQPGTGWAYASVSPLRLYKISQHSGGVKTGAIVWWANGIKNKGGIDKSNVHLVDIFPTFLELAGSSKKNEVDGVSFSPLLKDQFWKRNSPMYFQFMDNRAMRTEEYSLLEVDGSGWELYNTIKDPLETNNLANKNPELVSQLAIHWLDWWEEVNNSKGYKPESTDDSPHYKPQGDRGSGKLYVPTAMPDRLKHNYKLK